MTRATLVLAHRGDHRGAPENSVAAFGAAIAAGADGVELDVRASSDGAAIVLHDASLARVQGLAERARDLTELELSARGVPTLRDVLAGLPADAVVDIELKEPVHAAAVAAIREVRGPAAPGVIVSSFHPTILAGVRAAEPRWECWLIAIDAGSLAIADGCAGIALEWRAVGAPVVAAARERGLRIGAWTVRDRDSADLMTRLALDVVIAESAGLAQLLSASPRRG